MSDYFDLNIDRYQDSDEYKYGGWMDDLDPKEFDEIIEEEEDDTETA